MSNKEAYKILKDYYDRFCHQCGKEFREAIYTALKALETDKED